VNAEEIAQLVEELDSRLERLRVLYDQYFMGIEKIPPNIVQKDVDRRIWILRREKIRNTGIRFRFQQIVQKYNTFSSYWIRICREIENGTYKRDIIRAKKRFGEQKKPAQPAVKIVEAKPAADSEPPRSVELNVDVDVEVESARSPAPAPAAASFDTNSFDTSDLDSDEADRTYKGPAPQLPPEPAPRAAPVANEGPVPLPPPDLVVEPKKPITPLGPLGRPLGAPAKPAPIPALQSRPGVIPAPAQKPLPTPAPRLPTPQVRAATPAPAIARNSDPTIAKKIASRAVKSDDDLDDLFNEALGPSAAAAKPIPAAPAAKPIATTPTQPKPAPVVQPRPAPAAQPKPAPVAAVQPKPANGPGASGEDYRQVYARLIESRRKNGESTAGLTYDSLAKNLRETTEKLKARSGGKAIDFDVVVKDGKTVLKPVVK